MTLLLCTVLIALPLWLIIGALNNIFAVLKEINYKMKRQWHYIESDL